MESYSPLLDTPLNGIPLDGTTHVLSLSVTVTNQFGVSGSAETTVEVSLSGQMDTCTFPDGSVLFKVIFLKDISARY